jgi:hypothetical protein
MPVMAGKLCVDIEQLVRGSNAFLVQNVNIPLVIHFVSLSVGRS